MTSAKKGWERVKAEGGKNLNVWLDREARAKLENLVDFHRLDQREIIRRLLLDIPLGSRDTNPMGLSGPEQQEYERQLRERQ